MDNFKGMSIAEVKKRLEYLNKKYRFVIVRFQSKRPNKKPVFLISNRANLDQVIEKSSNFFTAKIIRDMVLVTDNLAYWAIYQDKLDEHNLYSEEQQHIIKMNRYFINQVLIENKVQKK